MQDLDWRARAHRRLKQKGLSMIAASKLIAERGGGTSETQVRDWLNRRMEPGIDGFCHLAGVLGVSPLFLLQGDERFMVKVPLLGVSSGSERWTPFAEPAKGKTPEMAEFDFSDGDVFAVEVRGNGMSPVYRDRDQLYCQRRAGKHFDNLVGLDCVLRTAEGETLIKILDKGTQRDRYTLRSYNPLSRPMEDVEIDFAAPIIWVRRGGR